MRTRLISMGTDVEGIRLCGNPEKPEPTHTRIAFPGGDVDVARVDIDGKPPEFWVHIRVDNPEGPMFVPGESISAQIVNARLDIVGKATSQVDVGEFNNPNLYHLAVRISRR